MSLTLNKFNAYSMEGIQLLEDLPTWEEPWWPRLGAGLTLEILMSQLLWAWHLMLNQSFN